MGHGRFLMFINYLGTPYSGIQKLLEQGKSRTDVKTVLGSLEQALKCLRMGNRDSLRVVGSSRTDASVHAFSNSCHVDIDHRDPNKVYDPDFITFAVNQHLKRCNEAIRVAKTIRVGDDFHCRRAVTCRHYLYRLAVIPQNWGNVYPQSPAEFNMSHSVSEPFDMDSVHSAARIMSGTHDFTAFTSPAVIAKECKDPVKTMTIGVRRTSGFLTHHVPPYAAKPQFWEFHFKSKSFLYKQIRRMMGVLVLVGKGRLRVEDVKFLLDHPHDTQSVRRHMALPGHGLSLVNVEYDESVLDAKLLWPHGTWEDEHMEVMHGFKLAHEKLLKTLERRYIQLVMLSETEIKC